MRYFRYSRLMLHPVFIFEARLGHRLECGNAQTYRVRALLKKSDQVSVFPFVCLQRARLWRGIIGSTPEICSSTCELCSSSRLLAPKRHSSRACYKWRTYARCVLPSARRWASRIADTIASRDSRDRLQMKMEDAIRDLPAPFAPELDDVLLPRRAFPICCAQSRTRRDDLQIEIWLHIFMRRMQMYIFMGFALPSARLSVYLFVCLFE